MPRCRLLLWIALAVVGAAHAQGQERRVMVEGSAELLAALHEAMATGPARYPTGQATIEAEFTHKHPFEKGGSITTKAEYVITWKGDDLRVEGRVESAPVSGGKVERRWRDVILLVNNQYETWAQDLKSRRGSVVISPQGLGFLWAHGSPENLWFRCAGTNSRLARLFDAELWKDGRTIIVQTSGKSVTVTHQIGERAPIVVTADLSLPPGVPTSFRLTEDNPAMEEYTWTRAADGRPVPRRIASKAQLWPGGKIETFAEWTFKDVELDIDVPDRIFTFESLKLPDGTQIVDRRSGAWKESFVGGPREPESIGDQLDAAAKLLGDQGFGRPPKE